MRAMSQVKNLEDSLPKCDRRVRYLALEDHVPSEVDRCRRRGGCHILMTEVIVDEAEREGRPCE